jgi:3-oxoacyl-(acyl-carrier-protein) synthase
MSLKSALGHTLGAAGVHGAILALEALATGVLPGTRNLASPLETPLTVSSEPVPLREPRVAVTAAAFGGHNVALLLAGSEQS